MGVFTQSFPGAGRQAVSPVKSRGLKGADVNVSFWDFCFSELKSRGVAAHVVTSNGRWQSGHVAEASQGFPGAFKHTV